MDIGNRIYKLRTENKLSREAFAEPFGVTHQAVQKWEMGVTTPTVANLMAIARRFNVSLDYLVLGEKGKAGGDISAFRQVTPDYEKHDDGEAYYKNLALEYTQSTEEGLDIEAYREVFLGAGAMPNGEAKEKIADVLFGIVSNAGVKADYPYCEPSDLEGIRELRDGYVCSGEVGEDLEDKIKGAWLGRICGCLLGKPVEGMRTGDLVPLLQDTGNYPMHRYILRSDFTENILARFDKGFPTRCWADNISCAPVDDDTNYTVMAQYMIDRYGRDFTTENVGEMWMNCQGKNSYFTAERTAFINMANGYCPPNVARYKNPYREWIGAQIRGDYYGYINPGDPEAAADMAWRDAALSHVKNGIYGEMFVSAMLAGAAVCDDVEAVIRTGLGQIPKTSRLYGAIMGIIDARKNGASAEAAMASVHKAWDEHTGHGWCHTISNAMIVAAALLWGEGDYGKSVCLAVQTGFDTDCNGATVGSVIGMMKGSAAVGEEWTAPLRGIQDTSIFGVGKVEIEKLIAHTMDHVKK